MRLYFFMIKIVKRLIISRFLMINLTYCLEKCADFPNISADERRLIQDELRLDFKRLEALKRIPESYRNHEEKVALLHFEFIQAFLSIDEDTDINLFVCKELQKNTDTLHLLWLDTIKHFLSARGAEKISAYYLMRFRNLFSEPTSFAALIIYLLENQVTPEQIILSRMCHEYFNYKIVNIDEIHITYAFIQKHLEKPAVVSLLAMAKITHCGLSSFPDTNLRGENHCHNLCIISDNGLNLETLIDDSPQFSLIFQNFQHIFGHDFIFHALSLKNYHKEQRLSTMITQWLTELSFIKLEQLFADIQHLYHQSLQFNLFKNLCPSLTAAQAKHLFNHAELFWIILATSPSLFLTYTKDHLRALALKQAILLKDIDYIQALCHHKKFTKQSEYFYKELFDLHLHFSELPHESSICDELFHCSKRSEWVENAFSKLFKKLVRKITHHLKEFNADSFINIRDFYNEQRYQVEFLCSQGASFSAYPMDFYSFTSLILDLRFRKKTTFHLHEVLSAMVPQAAEDSHIKHQMMERIALESLKKARIKRQLLSILLVLKNHFSYSLDDILELAAREKIELLEIALTDKNCLQLTLRLLPEQFWLRFFNHRVPPRFENALANILQSSLLLTTLIEESSRPWLIQFLEQAYKKNTLFWFSLGLEISVYQSVFSKLTKQQKIHVLALSSSLNDNILHYVIAKKDILDILFQNIPYILSFFLIQQKNLALESPLFLSLNYPESFAFILEHISPRLHQNIFLEHQKDNHNIFQLAIKKIELLEIIHTHLDKATLLNLINLHFPEIISLYANRPDVLHLLFANMPAEQINEMFMAHEHHAFNLILPHRESFFCILTLLNQNTRFKILNLSCEQMPGHHIFFHLMVQKPNQLDVLLSLLDEEQILEMMQQDDVFEYVLQNQEILTTVFKNLSFSYQYRFSLIQNSKHESWQELISLHQSKMLNLLLPLLSNPLSLLEHPILFRAINHPQALSTLLSLIPKKERINLIQSQKSPLFFQLKDASSITTTLRLLADEDHFKLLQEKHRSCQHLLGFILSQHQQLHILLNELKPNNLYLLIRKIIHQHLPANAILANEKCLTKILQTLPCLTTIQFLKELFTQQAERLVSPTNRLILLKYILNQGKVPILAFRSFSQAEKKHPLYTINLHGEYLPHLKALEDKISAEPPSPRALQFV